ncbi:formate dehydrogenase accessory sulfurtransferase FdhD [Stetteria hydrogenophila]
MSGLDGLQEFRLAAEGGVAYEEVSGVRLAVDRVYRLIVNSRECGELVSTPSNLEDVGLGFAASELGVMDAGAVRVTVRGDAVEVEVEGLPAGSECGGEGLAPKRLAARGPYTWRDVRLIYSDFPGRTAGRRYGVSAHTAAIYSLDEGLAVVAHDVSRHTLTLKLAGLALRAGLLAEGKRLAAAISGRVSADMVARLASVGVGLVVSLRGPLLSGVEAARRLGVTLVANARTRDGRSLVLLSGELLGH